MSLPQGEANALPMPKTALPKTDAERNDALDLNEQERALYQRHLDNLKGPGGVTNKDGSKSTLYAVSVNVNGATRMIPTVYDGKIVSTKEAIQRAEDQGWDNFPAYENDEKAKARYDKMHERMERDTLEHKGKEELKNVDTNVGRLRQRYETEAVSDAVPRRGA